MKNLSQYIADNKVFIDEYFNLIDDINFKIIRESLQCSLIKDIMKQYDLLLDKYRDDKVLNNIYSRFLKPYPIRSLFTQRQYTWDKITDDMVQTFDPTSKEGTQLYKRLCSNRANSIEGICVFEIDETEQYGIKVKYSAIITHFWDNIKYQSLTNDSYTQTPRPTEALEYLARCKKIHIIELGKSMSSQDIRNERARLRQGVIEPGNVNQYEELAKKNMKRYRELAAKLKIEREANDEIPQKVLDIVQKVMDLSIDASKNPMKYSGLEWDIEKLLNLVGDKQTTSSYRGKSSTYGINGIMYYFTQYLTSKIKVAKGSSYEWDRETYKNARKQVLNMIANIENKLKEIEKKLSDRAQENS